jgi:hypothetical protein
MIRHPSLFCKCAIKASFTSEKCLTEQPLKLPETTRVAAHCLGYLGQHDTNGIGRGRLTSGEGAIQLTSILDQLLFKLKILFTFVTKQATLMMRSTILNLPHSKGALYWVIIVEKLVSS